MVDKWCCVGLNVLTEITHYVFKRSSKVIITLILIDEMKEDERSYSEL